MRHLGCSFFTALVWVATFQATTPVRAQWQAQTVPTLADEALLYGVHAVAPDDIWAVGRLDHEYAPFGFDQLSLVLHWDGATWTQVPSPSPGLYPEGGIDVQLNDVDGVAPDDLWAAGTYKTQHVDGFVGFQALFLHWDGSTWEQVEAPFTPVGATGGFITDLLAVARDDVWAFGQRANGAPGAETVGFVLHWDGDDWTEMPPTPTVNNGLHELREGTRLADGRLLVVGGRSQTNTSGGRDQSYAYVWDGSSWTDVAPPQFEFQTYLRGTAQTADGEVWVVGDVNDGVKRRLLLLRWDGGANWTRFEVAGFDPSSVLLEDVVAAADGTVWAVGLQSMATPPGVPQPLYLRWDGRAWTVVPADPAGEVNGWMRGTAAVGECGVVAVGQAGMLKPRIDRYECTDEIFRDDFESGDMSAWLP